MLKLLNQINNRRRYANEVRVLRSTISPGARVRVVRVDGTRPAMVMNVRAYAHGITEAFVQADDSSFSGWHGVDEILPDREVPR